MQNKSSESKAINDGFPKTKNQWFRFYSEVLNDHKVQSLDPTTFKGWINLLCLTNEHNGVLPAVEEIAFKLRLSQHSARELIDILVLHALIDIEPDGSLVPHNWTGRQFRSDLSTERVRKHRKNKRKKPGETQGNVSETPSETESEAETDTEADKIAAAAAGDIFDWLTENFPDPHGMSQFLSDQIDNYGEAKVRAGWSDYKRKHASGGVESHSPATLRGFISQATPVADKPKTELDAVLQGLRDEFAQEAASAQA